MDSNIQSVEADIINPFAGQHEDEGTHAPVRQIASSPAPATMITHEPHPITSKQTGD
jgi:hypothetical protein